MSFLWQARSMHGVGTLQGKAMRKLALLAVSACLCAGLLLAALAESGSAAGLLGKDGRVYACYRTKGKAKGSVRLVAKRKHCRKGEKKISWNATGQAGENGQGGSNGESGPGAEPGGQGGQGLEGRIEKLTDRVETLEEKLKGIANTDLTGMLSKLNGVSATQLQEAVKGVANVNALCAQATKLTDQTQALGGAFETAKVLGLMGLSLAVPGLPTALPDFGCPA